MLDRWTIQLEKMPLEKGASYLKDAWVYSRSGLGGSLLRGSSTFRSHSK